MEAENAKAITEYNFTKKLGYTLKNIYKGIRKQANLGLDFYILDVSDITFHGNTDNGLISIVKDSLKAQGYEVTIELCGVVTTLIIRWW